jgi:L-asparaginase
MRLHIITTGGTNDKIYFDAKSEYEVGAPVIADLLNRMNATFDFTVESLMRKDSLFLTDEDRQLIRQRVQAAEEECVLITHGTDGMAATARALEGVEGKTIVLTGSMQPAAFRESDAIFNIGCAIGAVQSQPQGVYIAINGQVFDGASVEKNVAENRFEAT